MFCQKLSGLANIKRKDDVESGDQLRVRGDPDNVEVYFTATTSNALILTPDAARHLAACLVSAANEAEGKAEGKAGGA